jgi:hypothetical protein
MAQPAFDPRITELAERIFTQLARDAATGTPAEAQATGARLARTSFILSQSFHQVLDELNASNLPKNQDFTMKVEDIAKWST